MSVTLTPFAGLDNTNVENPEALYLVAGSGTDLDGKLIRAVALVDPTTGAAMGPGVTTIADGADVAQGATTDTSSGSTIVGLLKNLKAALAGTLAVAAASTTLVTPASTTTSANSDNTVTFSHQVTRFVLQNNSGATVYVNEGSAATAGSTAVASGSYLDSDLVPVTALHVYTTAIVSVNGSTAGGLVVRGTY